MTNLSEEYKRYRWFFTSSGKLVVGGKNAMQNETLLQNITKGSEEYIVMHTREPGSPFCIIVSNGKNASEKDREECAIFTACFSRAWREGKRKAEVDIFRSSQLYKKAGMKQGTWGVKLPIEHIQAQLRLVLARQKGIIRAVPLQTVPSKEALIAIVPGNIDKSDLLPKLELELEQPLRQEELLAALPAGGSRIARI